VSANSGSISIVCEELGLQKHIHEMDSFGTCACMCSQRKHKIGISDSFKKKMNGWRGSIYTGDCLQLKNAFTRALHCVGESEQALL